MASSPIVDDHEIHLPELEQSAKQPIEPGTTHGEILRIAFAWPTTLMLALGISFGLGALALTWFFIRPVALLLVSVVIAEALSPLVRRLSRWMSRTVAIVLVYLTLLLVIGTVVWITISPLVNQAEGLVTQLPDLLNNGREWIETNVGVVPFSNSASLADSVSSVFTALPFRLGSTLIEVVLIVFLSIYWLLAAQGIQKFTLSLFQERSRTSIRDVLTEMGQTMGGYVRGTFISMVILGLITYIALRLIGVQYPLALATLTGLLEVIPILGAIIAGVVVVGITLLESPTQALITLVVFTLIHQFEGNILVPNVMRTQTDIPPLLVLVALVAGGSVGGLLGAFVAIPLTGALRVLVIRVVAPRIRRWSGVRSEQAAEATLSEG